jgi:hypothetical protein
MTPCPLSAPACTVGSMPALRLLVRASPVVLAAAAAVIWVRRRRLARRAVSAPRAVTVARKASDRPQSQLERQPAAPAVREPIDIVDVVDDLLVGGRA